MRNYLLNFMHFAPRVFPMIKTHQICSSMKKKSTDQIRKQLQLLLKSTENDSFVREMVKNYSLRKWNFRSNTLD